MRVRKVASEGGTIEYALVRSDRRTVEVRVGRDLTVSVRAPLKMPLSAIDGIVRSRARWIEKHRAKFGSTKAHGPRRYLSGEVHEFLGERYHLVVRQGRANLVRIKGPEMLIEAKDDSPEGVEAVVDNFLRSSAKEVFEGILDMRFAEMADILGGERPQLKVRSMKRKWGSCRPERRIVTLNLELVRAPHDLIDYVVVHELCHLKHRRHDARFYGLVSAYISDWKTKRAALNRIMIC